MLGSMSPHIIEIGDFDIALPMQQDVGRFDVAVYYAFVLGIFQRLAAFVDDFRDCAERQQMRHSGMVIESFSFHILSFA